MPSTGTGSTRIDAARGTVAGRQSRTAYKYFPGSRTVHSSVESALKGGGKAKREICVNTTSVAVLHEQTGTDVSGVNPPDFGFGEALAVAGIEPVRRRGVKELS
jgi:hypothetical protein